jgi:hypothetical protein
VNAMVFIEIVHKLDSSAILKQLESIFGQFESGKARG